VTTPSGPATRPGASEAIRSFRVDFPKVELDEGGHFAACEQPDVFCRELRDAFRPVR
jgi:pimeloyl-ACP methyl ester carboxylesterase